MKIFSGKKHILQKLYSWLVLKVRKRREGVVSVKGVTRRLEGGRFQFSPPQGGGEG